MMGQNEYFNDLQQLAEAAQQMRREDAARHHAARFYRAAHRHDNRIPLAVRIAVLERAAEHCECCGRFFSSHAPGLELHHLTYDRAYGEELPDDLMALCRDCHQGQH